jgi:hypothetical protein
LKFALERVEEGGRPSGQIRKFAVVDTDRLRPHGQGVAHGSARLGQCLGCRLRGTTGTVLRALPTTPKLAERLVRHHQTITQALEGLDQILGSLRSEPRKAAPCREQSRRSTVGDRVPQMSTSASRSVISPRIGLRAHCRRSARPGDRLGRSSRRARTNVLSRLCRRRAQGLVGCLCTDAW